MKYSHQVPGRCHSMSEEDLKRKSCSRSICLWRPGLIPGRSLEWDTFRREGRWWWLGGSPGRPWPCGHSMSHISLLPSKCEDIGEGLFYRNTFKIVENKISLSDPYSCTHLHNTQQRADPIQRVINPKEPVQHPSKIMGRKETERRTLEKSYNNCFPWK